MRDFYLLLKRLDDFVVRTLSRLAGRRPRISDDVRRDALRAGEAGVRGIPVVATLFMIAAVVWFVFWYFHWGMPALTPDRLAIPTAVPTPTARTIVDPWRDHQWLSQEDARTLREKPNVINLALLVDGGSRYSATTTVEFPGTTKWNRGRPVSADEFSVSGTAFQLRQAGRTYNLNLLQPFVFRDSPEMVYIVDAKGQIMQATLAEVRLIPLGEAKPQQPIAPNPNLSFTLGR